MAQMVRWSNTSRYSELQRRRGRLFLCLDWVSQVSREECLVSSERRSVALVEKTEILGKSAAGIALLVQECPG